MGVELRRLGAIAGLAPSALVGLLYVVTGVLAGRTDGAWAMAGIAFGAVLVGWLAGPLAGGSVRSDLRALISYALLAGAVYVLLGAIQGAWMGWPDGARPDLADRATRFVGQLAYGLLYLPFWAAFVSPFAFAWVMALRALRRRAGLATIRPAPSIEGATPALKVTVRPRRLMLLGAAVVLGYGLFVALLPLWLYSSPRPPWWPERPVALFGLFSVPGVVAAIGALRGIRPIVAAAGVLCLLQAYVAFSGVTVGFVVPGLLLIALAGSNSWRDARPVTRTMLAGGVAVVALTIAAWISLLALQEPRCYVLARTQDGALLTTEVPATDQMLYGPMPIQGEGSGCSSAELTVRGMGASAVLAIGSIAVAATAASARRQTEPD